MFCISMFEKATNEKAMMIHIDSMEERSEGKNPSERESLARCVGVYLWIYVIPGGGEWIKMEKRER